MVLARTHARKQRSLQSETGYQPSTSQFASRPIAQLAPTKQSTSPSSTTTQRYGHYLGNIPVFANSAMDDTLIARKKKRSQLDMPLQTKLTVGQPNDVYEQEADRVGDHVVNQLDAASSQAPLEKSSISRPAIRPLVQTQASNTQASVNGKLESSVESKRGNGAALPESIRKPMERSFNADFSQVNIHTNSESDQLNRSLHSRAFTTGQDIFFRQGEYDPGDREGQKLLAHELTHVVQQSGGDENSQVNSEPRGRSVSGEKPTQTPAFGIQGVIQMEPTFEYNDFVEWVEENYGEDTWASVEERKVRNFMKVEARDTTSTIDEQQFWDKYSSRFLQQDSDDGPAREEVRASKVQKRVGAAPQDIRDNTYSKKSPRYLGRTGSDLGNEFECMYCDDPVIVERKGPHKGTERGFTKGRKKKRQQPPVAHPKQMPYAWVTGALIELGTEKGKKHVTNWGGIDAWENLKKKAGWKVPLKYGYECAHTSCNASDKDTPYDQLKSAKTRIKQEVWNWVSADSQALAWWKSLP